MNRIQVSSSDSGPANFTFGVNPGQYDPVDEAFISSNDVLQGPTIYQRGLYDSRIRTLSWNGYEVNDSSITSIVDYFRSIEGEIRYFNFQDLDDINERWDTSYATDPDWKKARVITLKTKPMPGGRLRYEYVQVLLQPEY